MKLMKRMRAGLSAALNYSEVALTPLTSRSESAWGSVPMSGALAHSAVWSCLKITSGLVGSMPIQVFERSGNDQLVRASDHPLEWILKESPNRDDTPAEMWTRSAAIVLAQGNAYAEKIELNNRVRGLAPIYDCKPIRNRDGVLTYRAVENGRTRILPREKVVHLRAFNLGGDLGLSAIRYGANSLGTALSADQTARSIFNNGLMAGGFIETPSSLTDEQRDSFQDYLDEFSGSSKTGKTMILEDGVKFNSISLNPEDAQLLDTRRFNIEEICRWFGTPPVVVGHSPDGQTMWGSGIEQVMLSWLTVGIGPFLETIEQRLQKDLLTGAERNRFEFKFDRSRILRMDSKALAEYLSKLVINGIMSRNEARGKIELPPKDGGDELLAQKQMTSLQDLLEGDGE